MPDCGRWESPRYIAGTKVPVANGPHWPEVDQGTSGLKSLGSPPDHTETFAVIRSHITNRVKGFDPKSFEKVQSDN